MLSAASKFARRCLDFVHMPPESSPDTECGAADRPELGTYTSRCRHMLLTFRKHSPPPTAGRDRDLVVHQRHRDRGRERVLAVGAPRALLAEAPRPGARAARPRAGRMRRTLHGDGGGDGEGPHTHTHLRVERVTKQGLGLCAAAVPSSRASARRCRQRHGPSDFGGSLRQLGFRLYLAVASVDGRS